MIGKTYGDIMGHSIIPDEKNHNKKNSIDLIRTSCYYPIVEYFLEKQMEVHGKDLTVFDADWWREGNKAAFWKMVRKVPRVDYWKKVIDFVFSDRRFLNRKDSHLRHVISASSIFSPNMSSEITPDKIKPKKHTRARGLRTVLLNETQRRLAGGGRDGSLDSYFDEFDLPKIKYLEDTGLIRDFRFRKMVFNYTGSMPNW